MYHRSVRMFSRGVVEFKVWMCISHRYYIICNFVSSNKKKSVQNCALATVRTRIDPGGALTRRLKSSCTNIGRSSYRLHPVSSTKIKVRMTLYGMETMWPLAKDRASSGKSVSMAWHCWATRTAKISHKCRMKCYNHVKWLLILKST